MITPEYGGSSSNQTLPLRLYPLHALHLAHEINIFRDPPLRPHHAAQDHHRHLQKHLELRCQALVHARGRRDPLREAFQRLVQVACPEVFDAESRRRFACVWVGLLALGLVRGWVGPGSKGEWVWEDEDHVCENGYGAVLHSVSMTLYRVD